jgi:hypothetical protein
MYSQHSGTLSNPRLDKTSRRQANFTSFSIIASNQPLERRRIEARFRGFGRAAASRNSVRAGAADEISIYCIYESNRYASHLLHN